MNLLNLREKNSTISSSESMAPPSTAFCFPGKHFDHHQSSFLVEDCKDGLKVFVAQNDEVLYYGEFSYKYSNVEHKAAPLPDAIQQVVDRIHQNFPSSEKVNSCLITKYTNGSSTCPPQITKFNNVKSDTECILFGVPQGSVLGPLLFLLYINDIVNSASHSEFVIFADDTNIFISAENKEEAYNMANNVLKCVCTYLKLNQLHINLSKCAFMYFRPNLNIYDRMICARSQVYNKAYTLSVNGQKIRKVDKVKFLGVFIDDQLSWDYQIDKLKTSCCQLLYS